MLIEFTVGNFLSFREPVTLSLEAAAITSQDKSVDENNLIPVNPRLNLLTSAAVYGANASGKSNLVSAIASMRSFILNSARESQADDPIKVETFRLSTETENQPAHFEMIFLLDGQKYRYGFEVTPEKVGREWLHYTPTIREVGLFQREGTEIKANSRAFKEGRGLEEKTRPNALFLSVVAQFNGPIATKVLKWFRQIGVISGLEDITYGSYTIEKYMKDQQRKKEILELVRSFDLGIDEITLEEMEPEKVAFPEDMPDELKKLILQSPGSLIAMRTSHTKYDSEGRPVGNADFNLRSDESDGTQKLFFLSGPILDVLSNGKIMIVDEMEARMHPLITYRLIQLFNSVETNPKRAQLIFTTHDTNLLDKDLFRRDQIWFVEKDSFGASHLYSLVEFKPRYDEAFEKNYLRGKFGATPYLGDLSRVLRDAVQTQDEEAGNGA